MARSAHGGGEGKCAHEGWAGVGPLRGRSRPRHGPGGEEEGNEPEVRFLIRIPFSIFQKINLVTYVCLEFGLQGGLKCGELGKSRGRSRKLFGWIMSRRNIWCQINSRANNHAITHFKQQTFKQSSISSNHAYGVFWCNGFGKYFLLKWFCRK